MLKYVMKSFVFGLFFGLSSVLLAQDTTWIHVNGRSFHESGDFRAWNPGLGVERSFSRDWSWATGWYRNSIDRTSGYGLIKRSFVLTPDWTVNVNAGGVTGYRGWPVAPVLLPEACFNWVCGFYIPKLGSDNVAAAAFYLRIPLQ